MSRLVGPFVSGVSSSAADSGITSTVSVSVSVCGWEGDAGGGDDDGSGGEGGGVEERFM